MNDWQVELQKGMQNMAYSVDGKGVKGSMTDSSKAPLWLVPTEFFFEVLYADPGAIDYWSYIVWWLNREPNGKLGKAVDYLVVQHGAWTVLEGVARVMGYGANKYETHNWRRGMKWSEVASAALRHIMAEEQGEANDPESGLPHWAHLGCCLAFLLEYEAYPELYAKFDDRYVRPVSPV